MSKSPADQREHEMIDRVPSRKQNKYGFADTSDIDWHLQNTSYNKAFNAIYNWGYHESSMPDLSTNKNMKTYLTHDIDKSKKVKFSAK